jgi:hypothetical protein
VWKLEQELYLLGSSSFFGDRTLCQISSDILKVSLFLGASNSNCMRSHKKKKKFLLGEIMLSVSMNMYFVQVQTLPAVPRSQNCYVLIGTNQGRGCVTKQSAII